MENEPTQNFKRGYSPLKDGPKMKGTKNYPGIFLAIFFSFSSHPANFSGDNFKRKKCDSQYSMAKLSAGFICAELSTAA